MRIAAAALALVALFAAALAWLQNPNHITANEAVRATERAFAAAGLRGAVVGAHPVAGVHVGRGGTRVAVWITDAKLDGATVQLWLARSDGASVYLDDRSPDRTSHLLTEAQFDRLDAFYENPAAGRQIRRNLVLTIAAALVVALAACVSVATPTPAPAATPSPAVPLARPRRSQPLRAQPNRSPQEA